MRSTWICLLLLACSDPQTNDAGVDSGMMDAGMDAAHDAGSDSGPDAGPCYITPGPWLFRGTYLPGSSPECFRSPVEYVRTLESLEDLGDVMCPIDCECMTQSQDPCTLVFGYHCNGGSWILCSHHVASPTEIQGICTVAYTTMHCEDTQVGEPR